MGFRLPTNAQVAYQAGGVGHPGTPGEADWRSSLGRYWSHEFAERIVEDPDESQVWLLTSGATFRRFNDDDSDDLYESAVPSDEYRTLEYNSPSAGEWSLTDLDGTVTVFNTNGTWQSRTDRFGSSWVASYTGTVLDRVDFPDGRYETFSYHTGGKLQYVTQYGIDGTSTRVWEYTWNGDDLERVEYPDGRADEFAYDPTLGYMTRRTRFSADGLTSRIEGAWQYTASGRLYRIWKGSANFADAAATDQYEYSYDDENLPSEVEITDPLANVATYSVGYDPVSLKPKLVEVEGDCPTCGTADEEYEYSDGDHPLLRTAIVDGLGHRTEYTYDSNGQVSTRTEAVGTAESRVTSYSYDATFPGLVTSVERPSTSGSGSRETDSVYDPVSGVMTSQTISGAESTYSGGTFSLTTTYSSHTAAGRVGEINPPGYGTSDVTELEYLDADWGAFLPSARIVPDPEVVGGATTSFTYDPFGRRETVTDPNGTVTRTTYDEMGRVVTVTAGYGSGDDLVTTYEYDDLGDLAKVIRPLGNSTEYVYDASGRLEQVLRLNASDVALERTFSQYDDAGNRTFEHQQRWESSAWVDYSTTQYEYSTRCHLDRVTRGDGSGAESITEFDYDCNGNLKYRWDPNHPSSGGVADATEYHYDSLDRLSSIDEPWGPGGADSTTTYEYDVQDHLIEVTDAEGNVTEYEYSDRDLLTEENSIGASGVTTHSYNDHGVLVSTTDARSITVGRTVDEIDRVTLVDYPTDDDVVYTYGDDPLAFEIGRVAGIQRGGTNVLYEYDRFGRVTRDGDLYYDYDDNGNRTEIAYGTSSVISNYTFDFADRELSLVVDDGTSLVPIVSAAEYLPGGPLAEMTIDFGPGGTESRSFTEAYFPASIETSVGSSDLEWDYTVDAAGNITMIDDTTASNEDRSFGYQDHQYFLTCAGGPWAPGSACPSTATPTTWTYDRIGNRLTETDGGGTDDYNYYVGSPLRLEEVDPSVGDTQTYLYDAAGNTTSVQRRAAQYLDVAEDGRIEALRKKYEVTLDYDGRGYLAWGWKPVPGMPQHGFALQPFYSSDGTLHVLRQIQATIGWIEFDNHVFYFAGRPVATLETAFSGPDVWRYLATDHLGTPAMAIDDTGTTVWSGGFEPFGRDYQAGTASGALANDVFLRLPGQWEDELWEPETPFAPLYYNVHRWYEPGTGRYSRTDPLGLEGGLNLYGFAMANPVQWSDPLGLKVELYCHPVGAGGNSLIRSAVGAAGFSHCFVRIRCDEGCGEEQEGYDLRLELDGREGLDRGTISGEKQFGYGHHASIVPTSPADWNSSNCERENCIRQRFNELKETGYRYPFPSGYLLGPNSNTFAVELLQACGISKIYMPSGVPPFDNWKYPLLPPVPAPVLD